MSRFLCLRGVVMSLIFLAFFFVTPLAHAQLSISGTLYQNDGVTPITTGKTITAAVGTSTPSLHSVTSDGSGNYTISGIATSTGATSGASWTARTSSVFAWIDVVHANGLFVAVSCGSATTCNTTANSRVMTSPDGITWTNRSAANNNDSWASITYGNGLFVVVGNDGDRVMTSPDGINWSARSAAGDNDSWLGVTYNNGLFVAVGDSGDRVMTSPDGITWTARSAAGDNDTWQGVTYGNGLFVAVGGSGDRVMTSPDGITWTARSVAGNNDSWRDVTFTGSAFVAVGNAGDRAMTSPNGTTWTVRGPATGAWMGVTYGNGTLIAVSCGVTSCTSTPADRVMRSVDDGVTWATTTNPTDASNLKSVDFGAGKFVIVAHGGALGERVFTSDAGFGDTTPITLYVNGATEKAATITYGPRRGVSSITGLNLWRNTVRVQHSSSSASVNLAKADFYDYDQDRDISFDSDTATTSIGGVATTTDFVVATGTTLLAPQNLALYGDVTQGGLFKAEQGTVYLLSSVQQTISDTYVGAGKLHNVTIRNTSGTGAVSQSIVFSDAIEMSGTLTMAASTSAQVAAGKTIATQDISLNGAVNQPIWLRSSSAGSQWRLNVSGEQLQVSYVDVKDSNALTAIETINGVNRGGNSTNWAFTEVAAAIVWNSTAWTQYATITINQTVIDANLTNYPVYVDLADLPTAFWETTIPDCGDIRVMNQALTVEFAREVVECDIETQTGELYVKIPTVSETTDTVFKVFWNGTHADYAVTATYGQRNVWDTSIFNRVFHLAEGRGETTSDSTSNAQVGTLYGGATWEVDNQRGTGLRFDGSDDYVLINISDQSRFSGWIKTSQTTGIQSIVGNFDTANQLNRRGITVSGGNAAVQSRNSTTTVVDFNSGYSVANNNWHQIFGKTNSNDYAVYGDGVLRASSPITLGGSFSPSQAMIGASNINIRTAFFNGVIDEARVYTVTPSDAWIKAEYLNRATTSDFYTVSFIPPIIGSTTLANHDATQTDNAFDFQNKLTEPLFAFKLTPNTGTATVTAVTIGLSGVEKVVAADFTNLALYVDTDNDGEFGFVDDLNPPVSYGVMEIVGTGGTIVFADDFALTAATNFIVIGSWNAPQNGSFMRMALPLTGVSITNNNGTQDIFGSVTPIQHNRNNKGGAFLATVDIGGAPPAGDTPRTGGGQGSGEQIGNDPNFRRPTANSGSWTNGTSAYDQIDNTYASDSSSGLQSYINHSFAVSAGNQIVGIEVRLEANGNASSFISTQLSWNAGTSWTSTKVSPNLGLTDGVYTLGGAADLWGRSWTPAELDDTNFAIRVTNPGLQVYLDEIQVRVYYQATGGGSGGGADI